MILKPRSSFWLTRFLNWFGGNNYITTIGDTVYYPDHIKFDVNSKYFQQLLDHELVHVKQYEKYGVLGFLLLYALIPFPVLFSYFRWKFEREAYMIDIKNGRLTIEEVVDILWYGYVIPWPKPCMRKWLKNAVAKD